MKLLFGIVLVSLFSIQSVTHAADCVIKMVYKEGEKEPLINKKPDNSGAYKDLFSQAAKNMGCQLSIKRYPKKRLHRLLAKGKLDFYPGASYSAKRAEYLVYIANGFETAEYGITALDQPEIGDYQQVKEFGLTWLMELDSSKTEFANKIGVKTNSSKGLNIDFVRQFIDKRIKTSFYVADKELVDYYLKSHDFSSFKDAGLKIHYHCCGGAAPMYMGFSRYSPHYKEIPNPNYVPSKKTGPENFPVIVDPNSVAGRLGKALAALKVSGETTKIYKKHFSGE